MLPRLPSCTHPWGAVPSTEHPAQCLCTHQQDTRDFPQSTSRASHWGLGTGTGTVAPSRGGAGPACRGAENLTYTGGLWCCQGLAGGSATLSQSLAIPGRRSRSSARLSPRRVPPAEGPASTDPACILPAQWLIEMKCCSSSPLPALPPQPRAPQGYPPARAAPR